LSVGEHFLNAVVWSWASAWAFAADRVGWSVPVALVAAIIVGVGTRLSSGSGSFWSYIRNGVLAAVLSPIIVIAAVFLYNFVILFPLNQERQMISRIEILKT
jgi:hypothetical protein